MSHKDISKWESMNIISNYMIINYLNCLLKGDVKIHRSLPLLAASGCHGGAAFCSHLR